MKILVCISNVPDTTTKITFSADNKSFNSAGVQYIINPYDEIALTRALELKESLGGTVTVINVGLVSTEANIRKALAIGADDAIRINAEPLDAFFVASQIAEVAKKNQYDIILTGRESIDYNSGLVAGMLAELLEIPSVSVAVKLDINGTEALLEREIDGGKEVLTTSLPFVASAQKGMAEPRIPNMRGIMTARTKPLQVVEPSGTTANTAFINYSSPPAKAACKLVSADNPAELISLLHNEAKVF
ncbi:MAG TPA: electron transfer flavoprotein subunit beta/FixA family protein [Bacteroidia bacterium]|nr:electron transfer flavoprotein subunit beta/FixA family protein [Bacteroidia bacterium]